MIRLTLHAQSYSEVHSFDKSTILLGAELGRVDLVLPGPEIQAIHLKIVEQNGCPVLINYMNDPFVLVNGHPFGKKILKSGDRIEIHQTRLLFENLDSTAPEQDQINGVAPSTLLENKIKTQAAAQSTLIEPSLESNDTASFSFPFEKEIIGLEGLDEEEFEKASLEKYLKELESAHEIEKTSLPESPEQRQVERKATTSLKDDYLRDLDDENHEEQGPFKPKKESRTLHQAWKWIFIFILSLVALSGGLGAVIYFTVTDKAGAQETKAAQGIADVAMTLAYAQLNHLKPHNQNWSDADFLKNNLQLILPDTASYASQIDAQGQLNCCPYSLRIYTSSNLSHFLLIAQPAPSLLNWLISQSLIVVDSNLMELRVVKDVRSLNRLLANSDPLDGMNGKEISSLIKQGELIRLATLANDSNHLDFAPPKNLAWIRPGAENFIYNAPRYYRIGYSILQKAMMLSTSKGSSREVAALKQDIEHLSWLNHFVLYSDQGKKSAMLARQGVMLFAPSDKILFGYLLFNAQGKIHQVYLLKEEERKATALSYTEQESEVALQNPSEIATKEDMNRRNLEFSTIDKNHPIYIQLQSMAVARENELKPLATALANLVNQELQAPRTQFQVEFQNLSHTYLMSNAKHKQAIKETLDILYRQYEDISIHQFVAFVRSLNLEQLIQQEDHSLSIIDENCQQNMELLFTYIENSKSFVELDNLIHLASSWLTFDYIKDSNELVKYQNLLRNHILEQLERYLLSQKKNFLIKSEDREILYHILSQERLIKPEEKEFFLKEFDEVLTHVEHHTEEKINAE